MEKDVTEWYETTSIDRYDLLKEYAKENRLHMTAAEKTLWSLLRRTFYGFKFRRQHPINDFIADFICLEAKLIIEVDGAYHCEAQQQMNDQIRTDILSDMGYKVIRFTNEEVLQHPKDVINKIKEELNNRP